MVMDYGTAIPGNCVLTPVSLCDMYKTAVQAAINLNHTYKISLNRIELTPMIGQNVVQNEIFSLNDTALLGQDAATNGLAGLHYWSLDRDTPCPGGFASPYM